MTTTDIDFLAQVEDLLTSCDLPLLPSFENDSDEQILSFQDRKNDASPEAQLRKRQMKDPTTRQELQKAKDRNRRRACRERRRREREELQQEIEQLTEELQASKKNRTPSAWEIIAQRQLAARRSSEEQQKQLHKAVGVRDAMIKEFCRLAHEANQQFKYQSGWDRLHGFHNKTNST